MNRTQHPSNNAVLGAPAGWSQAELPVNALPITRTEVGGKPAVVSFWRPTAEEIADINAGAYVALWVLGSTMPPIAIQVSN